ncbi:hypothetical protein JYJ95_21565 [Corallococcus exiguus]|uniref:hypothetical protein n=1 Tax=Corallococcus exiguus TaxID=83462 RepID=UPI001A8F5F5F|nr:hypothetical protein [Corallococcus exiguus]MBN8469100.1 hypothetical protein [Corallococcus exiguus]
MNDVMGMVDEVLGNAAGGVLEQARHDEASLLSITAEPRTNPSAPSEAKLNVEVVKMLFQFITRDNDVDPVEFAQVVATARALGVAELDITILGRCVHEGWPLPPPNLGMLRTAPAAVLQAIQVLLLRGGRTNASGLEMQRQLRELLGGAPAAAPSARPMQQAPQQPRPTPATPLRVLMSPQRRMMMAFPRKQPGRRSA